MSLHRYFVTLLTFVMMMTGLSVASLLFGARAIQHTAELAAPDYGGLVDVNRLMAEEQQREEIRRILRGAQADLASLPPTPSPDQTGAAEELAQKISVAEARLQALQSIYGDQTPRVMAELRAAQASSPLGIQLQLVQIHPETISAMLVILCGLIGALVLSLRENLINENAPSFGGVLARVLSGMAMALCLYALARSTIGAFFLERFAGRQIGLDASSTVALGILAGLLGDDLVDGLRARAVGFLKPSPKPAGSAAPS